MVYRQLQTEYRHWRTSTTARHFLPAPASAWKSTTTGRPANSIFNSLNPTLNSLYRFTMQQQLLAGFGTGPNLRYLRIAKNNKKISDIAFKMQVDRDRHPDRQHLLGPGERLSRQRR